MLAAQASAWNRGDIDGFMNGYARSAATEFIAGDKLTRGWQTVRDRYKKKYESRDKMGSLAFSELEITQLDNNSALVVGRWKLKPARMTTLRDVSRFFFAALPTAGASCTITPPDQG